MSEDAMVYGYIERIRGLLDVNRPEQALVEATKGLGQYPDEYYLLFFKALAHLRIEAYLDAEDTICRAIKLEPELADGYHLRSVILNALLHFNGELIMAKEAVRIDPENETYLSRLAEAHLQSGELSNARQVSVELLRINPMSVESHELLARICWELDDLPAAEKSYRDALAIEPHYLHLQKNLISLLRQQRRLDEALEVLSNTIRQNPTNADLFDDLDSLLNSLLPNRLNYFAFKRRFEALPENLKQFYQDRSNRRTWFQNNPIVGNFLIMVGISFLVSVAVLIL